MLEIDKDTHIDRLPLKLVYRTIVGLILDLGTVLSM
jgi:hypothetical protein